MKNSVNKSLNQFEYLKKVDLIENNGISLKFDNLPDWKKNNISFKNDRFQDYYEVIELFFINNVSNYYLKLKRLIGEIVLIQMNKENLINFWDEDFIIGSEDANIFDDLEGLEISKYEIKKESKTANDWKNEYQKIEKIYLEFLKK